MNIFLSITFLTIILYVGADKISDKRLCADRNCESEYPQKSPPACQCLCLYNDSVFVLHDRVGFLFTLMCELDVM